MEALSVDDLFTNVRSLLDTGTPHTALVLVSLGVFNPITSTETRKLDIVRSYITSQIAHQRATDTDQLQIKRVVVGGFLVPCSEEYAIAELGSEAMRLEHRVSMW